MFRPLTCWEAVCAASTGSIEERAGAAQHLLVRGGLKLLPSQPSPPRDPGQRSATAGCRSRGPEGCQLPCHPVKSPSILSELFRIGSQILEPSMPVIWPSRSPVMQGHQRPLQRETPGMCTRLCRLATVPWCLPTLCHDAYKEDASPRSILY